MASSEHDNRYRRIVENAGEAIFVVRENQLVYWNRRLEEITGLESDRLATIPAVEIIDPVDRERVWDIYRQRMAGDAVPATYEARVVHHPDGFCWAEFDVVRMQWEGEPASVVLMKDISDRRQAEEERRTLERKLRLHVLNTPMGVVEWNREFEVSAWNPAAERIFGFSAEEAIGRHIAGFLIPEGAREHVDGIVEDLLAGRGGRRSVNENLTKDRGTILCDWYNTPLIDEENVVIGVASLVNDITERHDLEERVRQSEKMDAIGQLAGGIAHDFNNQLTGIMANADLVARTSDDPRVQSYIHDIIGAATRSGHLIRQLLAFARKGDYQTETVDVHDTIQEVTTLLARSIDKRITIRHELHARPPTATGDPSQLQSAFLNLALNARDAMPDGGVLTFASDIHELDAASCRDLVVEAPPGCYLRVAVGDNGIGISGEHQKRMFEPFFTTKEPGKGTGMGLAGVYGTMRTHGGGLRVTSEVGRGTTVELFLPRAENVDRTELVAGKDQDPQSPASILVVEDEPAVCDTIHTFLESLGHEVQTCEDGVQAVELYRHHWREIDLVLLDMVMPRMGGRETFHAMRTINPAARVLLLSGFSLSTEAQQLLEDGAHSFLQKPFRLHFLEKILAEVLAG